MNSLSPRQKTEIKRRHDKQAPFYAAMLIILVVLGISTVWVNLGKFFSGYLLDMTGPAWNYILIRLRFTSWTDNCWTRFFQPKTTFVLCVLSCYTIEILQYLNLYDSTYDPWDFLAYISLLIPLFIFDFYSNKNI